MQRFALRARTFDGRSFELEGVRVPKELGKYHLYISKDPDEQHEADASAEDSELTPPSNNEDSEGSEDSEDSETDS